MFLNSLFESAAAQDEARQLLDTDPDAYTKSIAHHYSHLLNIETLRDDDLLLEHPLDDDPFLWGDIKTILLSGDISRERAELDILPMLVFRATTSLAGDYIPVVVESDEPLDPGVREGIAVFAVQVLRPRELLGHVELDLAKYRAQDATAGSAT